jgi:hypothetical protein
MDMSDECLSQEYWSRYSNDATNPFMESQLEEQWTFNKILGKQLYTAVAFQNSIIQGVGVQLDMNGKPLNSKGDCIKGKMTAEAFTRT